MKICSRCFNLDSRPRITFKNDICNACYNADEKRSIEWNTRNDEFIKVREQMLKYAIDHDNKYHCIIPWSGGKDSSSIAIKLKKEFSLNPLLVTFSPLIPNQIGEFNRKLLIDNIEVE